MFPALVLLVALGGAAHRPQTTSSQKLPAEIEGKPLKELLEEWPDQYVKWILTQSERSVYRALETDEEKLRFIEFFWARRDPTPETPENEFRDQYAARFG
ncbi:MAG TPA: GWxTD domain-containing protein, partial [Vicinamibacteria bacterium]|nr:GWxTD domain-containing protein [Vicinamibacteria bacterium]